MRTENLKSKDYAIAAWNRRFDAALAASREEYERLRVKNPSRIEIEILRNLASKYKEQAGAWEAVWDKCRELGMNILNNDGYSGETRVLAFIGSLADLRAQLAAALAERDKARWEVEKYQRWLEGGKKAKEMWFEKAKARNRQIVELKVAIAKARAEALEEAAQLIEASCDAVEMGVLPYGTPMPTATQLAAAIRGLGGEEAVSESALTLARREARAEALEEAAKVADKTANSYDRLWTQAKTFYDERSYASAQAVATEVGAAIRALSGATGEGGKDKC